MNANTRLHHIQQRISLACQTTGRSPDQVKLLAVSKTFPAEEIKKFANAGQQAFGENYLQEAIKKITQLAESPDCPALEWHFIGPIQSNKTREIAEHFDWVHSIDRLKVAQRLSDQRPQHLADLHVLIQVNTSGESTKSGVPPDSALALAREIIKLPRIDFRGFMTIASNTNDSSILKQEQLPSKLLRSARQTPVYFLFWIK